MSETGMEVRTFVASDGYPLHVTTLAGGSAIRRVVML